MTDSTLPTHSRAGTASSRLVTAVTAVVVTQGVTRYLATTLAAMAAQTRAPGRVLVVDVSVEHDAGVPRAAGEAFAARAPDGPTVDGQLVLPPEVLSVHAPGARTFGDAVQRALAGLPPSASNQTAERAGQAWLWLLHDDSAPEPSALAELVRAVEMAPSVAIAGVKQRTWTDPPRLLEVGVRTSRSGRRMTGMDDAEVDQGQHDGRDDVLGVGIAGALVRRDVWDALGGTDPALGKFGDGLDLSRRARLAGHRVVVVPSASVRHAQAGYHGLRDAEVTDVEIDADSDGVPDSADPRRSFAARRRSLLHQRLTTVPLPLLPVVAVLAVVVGAIRSLVRVTTKEPALAVTELGAPFVALSRLGAIARSRSRARATSRLPRRALRPLQATWRDVWAEWRDRRLARAEARKVGQAPSELELGELAALASRRRAGLGALAALLVAATALGLGQLISSVAGGAALIGPALVPTAARLAELWAGATSGWVSGGLGAPGPADALLVALVPGTAVLGSSSAAVAGLLLGAVVLAGVGAWFASGAATRSVGVRAWAGLAWAAAPALLLGLGDGRIGAVLVHVMLPWVVLGLARAMGVQRVDTVVSGLVTARRRDDDVVDDSDLDADWRAEVAAHRDDVDAVDEVDAAERTERTEDVTDRADRAAGHFAAAGHAAVARATARADRAVAALGRPDLAVEPAIDPELRVGAPTPTGSLAAAAGAALAFAAVVAGAPSLLVPGLLVVLAIALGAPRGRVRVLLVPLPALVLLGPTLVEAAGRGAGGLRLLLADPGAALDSIPATPVEQLLGVPVAADRLVPGGLSGALRDGWPLAVGGAVLLLALLALLRGSPSARAVRVAWFAAAAGLAVAAVAGLVPVAASDGGAVHGWPGSGLSFAGAGLLAAAVIGTDGLRARLARSSFGWRQPGAVLLAVVVVAAPVATLGAWSWQARFGAATRLAALDRRVVPAVGQQAQASPTASRVLALAAGADEVLTWQLLRGDGPQLVDESAAVRARGLTGPLADATVVAPDAGTIEVEDLVARLGSGSSGDVSSDLAALAVADVLVPPATGGADTAARTQLVGRLDSTAGLERITANSSGVIWRVQPTVVTGATAAAPVVSSWARLVTAPTAGAADSSGTAAAPAPADLAIASDGRSVHARIPAGTAGRLIVLAERVDAGWHATLDGHALRSVSGGWRQTFEVGADGGRLVVELRSPNRVPWLVAQGVVGLLTVLLALPVRRRKAGRR
jgi:GT2 family glycosyltransferase